MPVGVHHFSPVVDEMWTIGVPEAEQDDPGRCRGCAVAERGKHGSRVERVLGTDGRVGQAEGVAVSRRVGDHEHRS